MNTQAKEKAPYYSLINYDKSHLREIYQRIVNEGIILDTSANDFVYYFTGKGKQPIGKLVNKGDLIYLAILLKECLLSEYEKNEWLNKYAPFFEKDKRTIIPKESYPNYSSKELKLNYLKSLKNDEQIIFIDDDNEVLRTVRNGLKNIMLYQDSELID